MNTDTPTPKPRLLRRLVRLLRDLWTHREYYWRWHLGWLPWQLCQVCGKCYWGGLPRWWWQGGRWQCTWQAAWADYCSRKCANEDMEQTDALMKELRGGEYKRVVFDLPDGGQGATSVRCDTTPEELAAIRQLMIAAATAAASDEANVQALAQPGRK